MASLITLPKFREFIPGTNTPAVGYKVQTFSAGTTTPLATYADAGLTTPNANPTVLDANGECVMYAATGALYKVQYQDNVGTPLWTVDNVTIGGGSGGGSAATSEWVASGLTPTFISATSYTVVGDQRSIFQVGRRQQSSNTAGTIYSTIVGASFGGGLTTVTVINDSGVLDSGLSVVNVGILSITHVSIPLLSTISLSTAGSQNLASNTSYFLGMTGTPYAATSITDELGQFDQSSGTFNAPAAGTYLITAMISFARNAATVTSNGRVVITGAGFVSSPTAIFAPAMNLDNFSSMTMVGVCQVLSGTATIKINIISPTFTGGPVQDQQSSLGIVRIH